MYFNWTHDNHNPLILKEEIKLIIVHSHIYIMITLILSYFLVTYLPFYKTAFSNAFITLNKQFIVSESIYIVSIYDFFRTRINQPNGNSSFL